MVRLDDGVILKLCSQFFDCVLFLFFYVCMCVFVSFFVIVVLFGFGFGLVCLHSTSRSFVENVGQILAGVGGGWDTICLLVNP